MLSVDYQFNRERIRSYTAYECRVDEQTVERELSFHAHLSAENPRAFPKDLDDERRGDVYPVIQVPADRMVWLSDWSFNAGSWYLLDRAVAIGGSLGRITPEGEYVFVLNCAVRGGEMEMYAPARPIRYLAGEWIAFCFHHIGEPLHCQIRASMRFTEGNAPEPPLGTRFFHWHATNQTETFPEPPF